MILAQNHFQAILLLVIGALCWALWAGMHKMTPKWRYELFCVDVALGFAVAVSLYAFTVGSLGFDGFSFIDDLMHAGKRQWLFALSAGIVFNLANMILLGAVSVAGLSVAIPLGLGISAIFGLGASLLFSHVGNPILVFAGSACFVVGVVLAAVAYSFLISSRQDRLVKEGKVEVAPHVPGAGKRMIVSTDAPNATKGLLLSGVAAVLMWIMYPLINKARDGEAGLGPYALMALFSLGVFVSTFVFDLFLINLPLEGEPIEPFEYVRGSLKTHLAGIVAGILLCTGILAELVSAGGPPEAQPGMLVSYGLKQLAPLVGGCAGVWIWKEMQDAEGRVRAIFYTFALLFVVGAACLIAAASFAKA
jgi:glucose uptake protein